jgi:predicted nucleotide-binding protein (sugar kinase/HSP70/actin superfamily)
VLPREDWNFTRLQSHSGEAPQKAARCHLLPDVYDVLHTSLLKVVGTNACPTVTATPESVKAAFTKENDVFAEYHLKYIDPVLNFADRKLFAHQMLQAWQSVLGLALEENDRAVESIPAD